MNDGDYRFSFLREEDLDGAYMEWFEDDLVMKASVNGRFPISRASIQDFLETIRNRERISWGIRHSIEGLVGTFSLQSISWPDSSAEFAILIGNKAHWSKGVGKMALNHAIVHAFDTLGLHRLSLGTPEFNQGMVSIAERAGFKQEGIRLEAFWSGGHWHNVLEFGLLKDKFETG